MRQAAQNDTTNRADILLTRPGGPALVPIVMEMTSNYFYNILWSIRESITCRDFVGTEQSVVDVSFTEIVSMTVQLLAHSVP